MFFDFLRQSNQSNSSNNDKTARLKHKRLNFEPLENRELLSVNPIFSAPADLNQANYDVAPVENTADAPTDVPAGVAATATAAGISISWTAYTDVNATAMVVQRSADGGTTWETLTETGALDGTTTPYVDETAEIGVTYKYQVAGMGADNTELSAFTEAAATAVLPQAAIAGPLTATPAVGEINLAVSYVPATNDWVVDGASDVKVLRKADGETAFTDITNTLAATPVINGTTEKITAIDDTAVVGTKYLYQIIVTDKDTATIGQTLETTTAVAAKIAAPTGVQAAADTDYTGNKIEWTAPVATTVISYDIYADGSKIGSVDGAVTTYTDVTAAFGTAVAYTVVAVNGDSSSDPSTAGNVTRTMPAIAGAAAAEDNGALKVTWTANSDFTYTVERVAVGGNVALTGDTTGGSIVDNGVPAPTPGVNYTYKITATYTATDSPTGTVDVTTAAAFLALDKPVVTATPATDKITLAWDAVDGAVSYKVYVSIDGGGTWDAGTVPTGTSYEFTGAAGTLYTFKVEAVGADAVATSDNVSAAYKLAGKPVVTATNDDTDKVVLTWDAVANATGYNVYRSVDGTTWEVTPTATLGSVLTWDDATAIAGITYSYKVEATAGPSISDASDVVTGVKLTEKAVLNPVTTSDAGNALSWSAVTDALRYTVQVQVAGGTWADLEIVTGTTTYLHATAPVGVAVSYRIIATPGEVVGGVEVTGATSTSDPSAAVTRPMSNPVVTAVGGFAGNKLTWDAVFGATSFEVYRFNASGPADLIATITPEDGKLTYEFIDADAKINVATQYQVMARAASGPSTYSANVTATRPFVASDLTVKGTTTGITLTWEAAAEATGYKLYKWNPTGGDGSGAYEVYRTFAANVLSFTDTQVELGKAYQYKLGVTHETLPEVESAVVTGALGLPASSLTTEVVPGVAEVKLTWTEVAVDPTSGLAVTYKLYRSVDGGQTWDGGTVVTGTTYTDTAPLGATYTYKLVASADASKSTSNMPTVTIPLAMTIVSTTSTPTGILISWGVVANADTYDIYRSEDGQNWGDDPVATGLVGTTWTDIAGEETVVGKKYYYKIVAIKGESKSESVGDGVLALAAPVLDATGTSEGVELTWAAVEGATGYTVQKKATDGTWVDVFAWTSGDLKFVDENTALGVVENYRIKATNGPSESAFATASAARTLAKAEVVGEGTKAGNVLTWSAIDGVDTYSVLKYNSSTDTWVEITTGITNVDGVYTFTDADARLNVEEQYKVKATKDASNSSESEIVKVTRPFDAPVVTTEVDSAAGTITLSWAAVENAESYTVYKKVGDAWVIVSSAQTGLTYVDSAARTGGFYEYYQVVANAGSSVSEATEVKDMIPLVGEIDKPVVSGTVTDAGVKLDWETVAGATSYSVWVSVDGEWTLLADKITSLTYTDTTVLPGSTVVYGVTANINDASSEKTVFEISTAPAPITDVTYTGDLVAGGSVVFTVDDTNGSNAVYTVLVNGEAVDVVWNGKSFTYAFDVPGTYTVTVEIGEGDTKQSFTIDALEIGLAAPTNVAGSSSSASEVDLTWDAVTGATSYVIYRSDSATGEFVEVGTSDTAFFTDNTDLEGKTDYFYKVVAVFGEGDDAVVSDDSAVAMVTTASEGPQNVVVGEVTEDSVSLTWDDVEGATSYVVSYVENGEPKSVTVTDPSVELTGLLSDTTYVFSIQAEVGGELTGATEITVKTEAEDVGFVINATVTDNGVDLTWSVVEDAASYGIWRMNVSTNVWEFVGSTTGNSISDTTVQAGSYLYVAYAYASNGDQLALSDADTVEITIDGQLTIGATQVGNNVSVSWNNLGSSVEYYSVWRMTGTEWVMVGTTTGTSYVDTGAAPGEHLYVAYAHAGSAQAMSNALTFNVQATDTPFLAVTQSGKNAIVSWNDVGADSYGVWRENSDGSWELVKTVTGTTCTDENVAVGSTYTYVVYANRAEGKTTLSNAATLNVVSIVKPNLTAATANKDVNLSWNNVGAVSYSVWRQPAGGSDAEWTAVATGLTSTTYADTNVEGGTYIYVVYAYGSDGEMALSNAAVASVSLLESPEIEAWNIAEGVGLVWDHVGAATYSVWRMPEGGSPSDWKVIQNGIVGDDVDGEAEYIDSSVVAGQSYVYFVYGYDLAGNMVTQAVAPVSIAVPNPQYRDDVLATVLNDFDLVDVG